MFIGIGGRRARAPKEILLLSLAGAYSNYSINIPRLGRSGIGEFANSIRGAEGLPESIYKGRGCLCRLRAPR